MHDGPSQNPSGGQTRLKSLIVEGWRFVPHSYAIVNQWQLLSLQRRADLSLQVVDLPFYKKRWESQSGLFTPGEEAALQSLALAAPGAGADVTLRITLPLDFTPSASRRTAVFGTSETQVLRSEQFRDLEAFEQLKRQPPSDITIVTPSRWSAEGFYWAGFAANQVLVIPHGCDTAAFRPMPDVRPGVRTRLSCSDEDFVFLHIGAMTGNKGIDLLLKAFAQICGKHPRVRLVLKGLDGLYRSRDFLNRCAAGLSEAERRGIRGKITYLGDSFSNAQMARLYQAADVYVSAYRAEGFNMPVLEAAASGLPVICTRGGATDDFISDEFAFRIDSRKVTELIKDQQGSRLEPDLEHLVALMDGAIQDRTWRARAAQAGPAHVQAHYSWDKVADMLVRQLWDREIPAGGEP